MIRISRLIALVFTALVTGHSLGHDNHGRPLERTIRGLVRELGKSLADNPAAARAVCLGQITLYNQNQEGLPVTTQPMFRHLLAGSLRDQGFRIADRDAPVVDLKVTFGRASARQLRLYTELLVSQRGIESRSVAGRTITDHQEIVSLVTGLFDLPTGNAEFATEFPNRIGTPRFDLRDNVVYATDDSAFGLEVGLLDAGEEFQTCPVSSEPEGAGRIPVVSLAAGEEFGVRIHNARPDKVAVALTIDGFNAFHFSQNEAWRELGKWIIPERGRPIINGWHIDGAETRGFLATHYADLPAAELGDRDGTISAVFYQTTNSKGGEQHDLGITLGSDRRMKMFTAQLEILPQPVAGVFVRFRRG